MKKCFLILLSILAIGLSSCSSDDAGDSVSVAGKQYVFRNDTLIVSVSFLDGGQAAMQAFNRGSICFSNLYQCSYSGEYPSIAFECHEYNSYQFAMSCQFSAKSSFNATVTSNGLTTIWEHKPFNLPERMQFNEYSDALDKNGDGVIDELDT